jgi:hypothetical protein
VRGAEDVDDGLAELVPRLGVDQQAGGGVGSTPGPMCRSGPARGVGHLGRGDLVRQQRSPQCMERPLATGDGGDEGKAGHQLGHVEVGVDDGSGEVVVEWSEVGRAGRGPVVEPQAARTALPAPRSRR